MVGRIAGVGVHGFSTSFAVQVVATANPEQTLVSKARPPANHRIQVERTGLQWRLAGHGPFRPRHGTLLVAVAYSGKPGFPRFGDFGRFESRVGTTFDPHEEPRE